MNYLFIQCQTRVPSPLGYSPPVGLIIYDVPSFVLAVCMDCGYYESGVEPEASSWQHIYSSTAWAFGANGHFYRGGQIKVLDDKRFRVEFEIGGAVYTTIRIPLRSLLSADLYSRPTRYIFKSRIDPQFGKNARRYLQRNQEALIDWARGQRHGDPDDEDDSMLDDDDDGPAAVDSDSWETR